MGRLAALVLAWSIGAAAMNMTSAAAADAWGCSYDKCVAYCAKVGGKNCAGYCSNKLTEKQAKNICK